MALTLIQLQAQRDAIVTAMTGVQLAQHGETRVQYRSIGDLNTALGIIEQQMSEVIGGNALLRSFKLTSSKDL